VEHYYLFLALYVSKKNVAIHCLPLRHNHLLLQTKSHAYNRKNGLCVISDQQIAVLNFIKFGIIVVEGL
jgi:hypothetical protein